MIRRALSAAALYLSLATGMAQTAPEPAKVYNGIDNIDGAGIKKYNVYNLKGVKVLSNASDLSRLEPGVYIVNGKKQIIE